MLPIISTLVFYLLAQLLIIRYFHRKYRRSKTAIEAIPYKNPNHNRWDHLIKSVLMIAGPSILFLSLSEVITKPLTLLSFVGINAVLYVRAYWSFKHHQDARHTLVLLLDAMLITPLVITAILVTV